MASQDRSGCSNQKQCRTDLSKYELGTRDALAGRLRCKREAHFYP